jgi:nucleotide-binding universal stress UspA family protein
MKVLVGVDGSSHSLATVSFVGRLLSVERDELIISYVSPGVPYVGDEQLDPAVAARAQSALSSAVFDEAVARLPAEWQSRAVRAELSGSPAASLLASIDERGVDLVAVGFRGAGLFERVMLGSVSRAIVQSAKVPVLVVKLQPAAAAEDFPATETARGEFRVLVAYDGQPVAAQAAALLARFDWPPDTRGFVLSVVRPMFVAELPDWLLPITRDADVRAMAEAWEKEHIAQKTQSGEQLREFQQTLPDCFRASQPIVAEGHAGEQILAAVAERQVDLVVMGSRGQGGVARLLLGTTTDQVIAAATASVLIVR